MIMIGAHAALRHAAAAPRELLGDDSYDIL